MTERATAIAHPNIALVKYWGKRDIPLNLPAAGSLSLTLAGIRTRTTVLRADAYSMSLGGEEIVGKKAERVFAFLRRMQALSEYKGGLRIESDNDFPTAAGLASSSSGFAALTLAADAVLQTEMSPQDLSVWSRIGSGSAARSIFGGIVEMAAGERVDGTDAYASQVVDENHWPMSCVIALTTTGEKPYGSTEAMNHTSDTSPYFGPWIESVAPDVHEAKTAIMGRDFAHLAQIVERSCLRMHASAMAADPGILYWNGLTVEVIHHVRALRKGGLGVCFTIDAGPHVKVFCAQSDEDKVKAALADLPGVQGVIATRGGPGAYLV